MGLALIFPMKRKDSRMDLSGRDGFGINLPGEEGRPEKGPVR